VVSQGKPHTLVSRVEYRVVLAHEHVSQDPERSGRGRDIQSHETEQAHVSIRDEVILGGQGVDISSNGEVEVGTVVVALDEVLAGDDFFAAEGRGDLGHLLGGAGEDGGARVHDGLVLGGGHVRLAWGEVRT
jgi:hypothetical protein